MGFLDKLRGEEREEEEIVDDKITFIFNERNALEQVIVVKENNDIEIISPSCVNIYISLGDYDEVDTSMDDTVYITVKELPKQLLALTDME